MTSSTGRCLAAPDKNCDCRPEPCHSRRDLSGLAGEGQDGIAKEALP